MYEKRQLFLDLANIFVYCIIDKHDNKNIAMSSLKKVLDKFAEKYNLDNWDGNISIFREFEPYIDEILENGTISDIPVPYPKLKKKLPKMIIRMGTIDEFEYKIAHMCDGKSTSDDIAEELGKTQEQILFVLEKLKGLGLVEF